MLEKFRKLNIRVSKCQFFATCVEYLGNSISQEVYKPLSKHQEAIAECPVLQNTQLKSFLGMVTYLSRHLPNLSSRIHHVNMLLKKDANLAWTEIQQHEFEQIRSAIANCKNLPISNPKEVVVITDANPYELGVQLCNKESGGKLKTDFCASAALISAQSHYSVLKRSDRFNICIEKFHKYLYGRFFIVWTDSKPVQMIFGANKALPSKAHPRLLRWALILSGYVNKMRYSKNVQIVDCLSRLPLAEEIDDLSSSEQYVININKNLVR